MVFAFVILFFFWIFLFVQFTEKMKKEFPDEYEKLGSPAIGFFSFKQAKASSGFIKFLFKREYRELGTSYTFQGNILLGLYVLIIVGFFTYYFSI